MFESFGVTTLIIAISGCFSLSTLWSLFLMPLQYYGLSVYMIDDERQMQLLRTKFGKRSTIINNNEGFGWIFGKWYIGYIYQSGDKWSRTTSCYVMATKEIIDQLTPQPVPSNPAQKLVFIKIFDRCGSYDYIYYSERKLQVTDFVARDLQQKAIAFVESFYTSHHNATVLLSGPPNMGKSVIALLLAKALKGSLVYEFNPTEPGNNFNNLYNKANPSMEEPMIVTFEEVDVMVDAIHNGKVLRHESKPISIYNKATWNTFMDNIDHKFYPYVIFLFTSNKPLSWFDEVDPSYMREGRVNLKITMDQNSCELVNPIGDLLPKEKTN